MSGTDITLLEENRLEDAPAAGGDERARPVNPRDEAMARIAAKYEEQQRGAEIAFGELQGREAAEREGRDPDAPAQPEAEAAAATTHAPDGGSLVQTAQAAATPSPAPAPVESTPAPPALRTVMVQGHPLQVTEAQFEHLASIGAVANLAMEQHARAQQGLQSWQQPPAPERQAWAPPGQFAPQQAPQGPPQGHAPAAPVIDRDRAAEIVQRLAYGSADDGVAAVQDLAAQIAVQLRSAAPAMDPQQLMSQAAALAYDRIRTENDLNTIGSEFPDIFNNRTRAYTAAIHLTEIKQRDAALGQVRPAIEAYREACRLVQAAFAPDHAPQPQSGQNGHAPAPQAAQNGNNGTVLATLGGNGSDRLERKRAAPRNPAAVSRAATLADAAPNYPTGSQIVDQMRRARHQMPMN